MVSLIRLAPAKINITLDILGKRGDGYHEISTIMTEVPLFDRLEIEQTGGGIEFYAPDWLPQGEGNLAFRAAEAFFGLTGISGGVRITLQKSIPAGAGLGGGSSDAAAVINGLNDIFSAGLTLDTRCGLAAGLGADIPFFIAGGAALCEGIGERITPLPGLSSGYIVLCKPEAGLSTSEVYARCDRIAASRRPDTRAVIEAMKRGDITAVAAGLCNALEEAALSLAPEIGKIKDEMLRAGALGACMSGSGSAVFALFDRLDRAEDCRKGLSAAYRETFLLDLAK